MGLVEKIVEIEMARGELETQLYNKINFIHENIGRDYRTDDSTVTPKYDIRLSYQQTLFIDKTLLTMSDEEFNNLTVSDFSRPKYKPITFEGLI